MQIMICNIMLQLNDAYEEVDEQRQVVAQWKRKTQKVTGELNDTKLLLEEQTSRNTLLEKKQRKFDSEIGLLQEDKKQEMIWCMMTLLHHQYLKPEVLIYQRSFLVLLEVHL